MPVAELGFPRVKRNAHFEGRRGRPRLHMECSLQLERTLDGAARVGENGQEAVALSSRLDHVAPGLGDALVDDRVMPYERLPGFLRKRVPDTCGFLDVGHKERDRPGWQRRDAPSGRLYGGGRRSRLTHPAQLSGGKLALFAPPRNPG